MRYIICYDASNALFFKVFLVDKCLKNFQIFEKLNSRHICQQKIIVENLIFVDNFVDYFFWLCQQFVD